MALRFEAGCLLTRVISSGALAVCSVRGREKKGLGVSAGAEVEARAGPVQSGRFYGRASTALSRGLLSDLVMYSRGGEASESDLARIPRGSAAAPSELSLCLQ